MKNLIKFCLEQHVLNNVMFIILMVIGAYCLFTSPVERYPNIHMGDIYVTTFLYGAAPIDVEKLVTAKMEKEIKQVKEVEFIKSTSSRNRSEIKIHYKDGSDYDAATANIKVRLEAIQKDLPSYVRPFTVMEAKTNEWMPVIRFNIFGNHDQNALNLIAKDLKVKLEAIDGVNKVHFLNEDVQEYHIKLSPKLLRKYGVPFQTVVQAIQTSNVNIPMGSLRVGDNEIFLSADEKVKSNDDVLKIIIRRDGDGNFVRVSDVVAETIMSTRKPSVLLSANGNACLGMQVLKTERGNAIQIKKDALKVIDEFKEEYKGKADFEYVITEDTTKVIDESVQNLSSSLLVGIFFVYIVMHALIGFKNAVLALVGIPFSFLISLIMFRFIGNSINEISLFGFILISGILVGDAIVVLENIHRHREEGESVYDAVVNGTAQLIIPVMASNVTTIAAFVPLLLMTGSTGAFFAILPKTVTFAISASTFEALFMLPLHYYDLTSKKKKVEKKVIKPNRFIVFLDGIYTSILKKFLDYKILSISAVVLLGVFSFGILGLSLSGYSNLIKVKFFPDTYPQYFITVEAPISTPLETTNSFLVDISKEVMKNGKGEFDVVSSTAGYYTNEDYQIIYGYHIGMVIVTMPPMDKQKFSDYPLNNPRKHLETVLQRVQNIVPEDVKVSVRPSYEGPPKGKPVSIRIYGQNDKNVHLLSNKLFEYMKNNKDFVNLTNLKTDLSETRTVVTMKVKTIKAKDYRLSSFDILGVGAGLIDGQFVGQYRATREDVDMKVMIDEKELGKPEDILNIPIIEDSRSPILISDVARFEYLPEISSLNRYNEQRSIEISAGIKEDTDRKPALSELVRETYNNFFKKGSSNVTTLSPQKVSNDVQVYYKTIANDYPGATVSFEGEFKATQDSYNSLQIAFIVSVLLIYIILAWSFQSYVQPFIIISTIIFASMGVIIGLLFTREDFTINVFIGVVGLAGVAVNDSIVLVDFINVARRNGLSLRSAILNGCGVRMRAIILTTVTTILGLLPTALGFPQYSPTWSGMAIGFVSGLSVSTLLTMTTIPVLYESIEAIKIKLYGRDVFLSKKKIVKKVVKKITPKTDTAE